MLLKPVAVIARTKAWEEPLRIVKQPKWRGEGPEPSEDQVMSMVVREIKAMRREYTRPVHPRLPKRVTAPALFCRRHDTIKGIISSDTLSIISRPFLVAVVFLSAGAGTLPLLALEATEPVTNLHFVTVDPPDIHQVVALGFNMVIVDSGWGHEADDMTLLNSLPAGTRGLVRYRGGCSGATATFQTWANTYKGNPYVYGFYLYDEPKPSYCTADNLKAESDWIHEHIPGVTTFVNLDEQVTQSNYTDYANAVDLVGLDPYPCVPWETNCHNAAYITNVINQALTAGVPESKIVPVYQASEWPGLTVLPTADQERQILATWATLIPTPTFDYVYTWKHYGETRSLKDSPELQAVFQAHNK